jgi:hypothetical protein
MYPWLVLVHLVGLVLFAFAHGPSMIMSFRIREERDPKVVAALLHGSRLSTGPMYVGLLLLVLGGLGAAGSGGLLLAPWVVASYVVLVLVLFAMYAIGSPYYGRLRLLVGEAGTETDPAELRRALASRRPEALALIGFLGLLVLVYLMVIKPG